MASARLGVSPISKTVSTLNQKSRYMGYHFSIEHLNHDAIVGFPQAQFILGTDHTMTFFPSYLTLFDQAFPSVESEVPTVATGTFCPIATFGAPHIFELFISQIDLGDSKSICIGVLFTFQHFSTTIPFSPP